MSNDSSVSLFIFGGKCSCFGKYFNCFRKALSHSDLMVFFLKKHPMVSPPSHISDWISADAHTHGPTHPTCWLSCANASHLGIFNWSTEYWRGVGCSHSPSDFLLKTGIHIVFFPCSLSSLSCVMFLWLQFNSGTCVVGTLSLSCYKYFGCVGSGTEEPVL